jgi:acyl-[acyl-carrier-protein]-phospholipid O-acyltransferase/long-chain-fatty-acid--[acyl-carrier-protein] ligase
MNDANITLFKSLLRRARQFGPLRIIMKDKQQDLSFSYASLLIRSALVGKWWRRSYDALSTYLYGNEQPPSQRRPVVAILLPASQVTVMSLYGLTHEGAVLAMLNPVMGRDLLRYSCTLSGAKYILTSRQFVTKLMLQPVIEELIEEGLVVLYVEDLRHLPFFSRISLLLRACISLIKCQYQMTKMGDALAPLSDQPAVILFTSGSEGKPKAVVLSHANLLINCQQLQSVIPISTQDILVTALPLFHAFGLTGGVLLPLLSGVTIILYPSPLHYDAVMRTIAEEKASLFFSTDSFLKYYSKYAGQYDISALRYIFAGGEKLTDTTRDLWKNYSHILLLEGYGATEASPAISMNQPASESIGSVGTLLPGMEYFLEPVPSLPLLANDEMGRLWVGGHNIMLGYIHSDYPGDLTRLVVSKTDEKGRNWHDTGDIVRIDSRGQIYILGRAKRFAKINGEMVSLLAVEEWLGRLFPEHIHALMSVPDKARGERLLAFSEGITLDKTLIMQEAKQQQHAAPSNLWIPNHYYTIEIMPRLATGKVDYYKLKEYIEHSIEQEA